MTIDIQYLLLLQDFRNSIDNALTPWVMSLVCDRKEEKAQGEQA